jgi:hypothetical protein
MSEAVMKRSDSVNSLTTYSHGQEDAHAQLVSELGKLVHTIPPTQREVGHAMLVAMLVAAFSRPAR